MTVLKEVRLARAREHTLPRVQPGREKSDSRVVRSGIAVCTLNHVILSSPSNTWRGAMIGLSDCICELGGTWHESGFDTVRPESHGIAITVPSPAYTYRAPKIRFNAANAGSPVQCPGAI